MRGTLADPFASFGAQLLGFADSESGLTLFGERFYGGESRRAGGVYYRRTCA